MMNFLISNTNSPSLTRNMPILNGVWTSIGGSRTVKIGNFIYDYNDDDSITGKSFIGVQSPYENFTYRHYSSGDCKNFGVEFKVKDDKKSDYSKLNDTPEPPYPLGFNANWQGDNGGMISWKSNANNTGVTNSTIVMVNGSFYDLGKQIAAAAVNENFILAIHVENGMAIFREYYFKYNKDTKQTDKIIRVEKNLNAIFGIDNDEISRVNGIISHLNDLRASPPHDGATISYKVSDSSWIGYHMESATLSDGMEDAFYDFRMRMKIKRYNSYLTSLNASVKFSDCYRASFATDLSKMLLHLDGSVASTTPRFVAEFVSAQLGVNQYRIANGFATFTLGVTWTNQDAINEAIKNKSPEIPAKEFDYKIEFEKSQRFEEPIMDWSSGNGDDGFGGYVIPASTSDWGYGNAARGKLKADNVFLFAELVGNAPKWLSANIDVNVLTQVRYSPPPNFLIGQLNWKEVSTVK